MNKMVKCALLCLTGIFILSSAHADEKISKQGPWEKAAISFGGFISSNNTAFRLGSGAGVDLDIEEFLGLDTTNSVFRMGGLWRFTENRRHRMDLSWFRLQRSGDTSIGQDIVIPGEGEEEDIIIETGTKVESYFDIDLYQLAYSYSFLQDDRIDVAARVGLYIMPMQFGIKATGVVDNQGEADFTAPLPTFGFRMDIALTPKWFFRSGTQLFYLEYEEFVGSILAFDSAVEYVPWKHVGIGLGVDALEMRVEADGEDYTGIDFTGAMEFSYIGLQLYVKAYF